MKSFKFLQQFFILLMAGFMLCAIQACGEDEDNLFEKDPTDMPGDNNSDNNGSEDGNDSDDSNNNSGNNGSEDNNGSDDSNDESYEEEEEPEPKECSMCNGSGECPAQRCDGGTCSKCDGKGYTYYTGYGGNQYKEDCECSRGKCSVCRGTGECRNCGGDGYL
jgi:hypothetical protein